MRTNCKRWNRRKKLFACFLCRYFGALFKDCALVHFFFFFPRKISKWIYPLWSNKTACKSWKSMSFFLRIIPQFIHRTWCNGPSAYGILAMNWHFDKRFCYFWEKRECTALNVFLVFFFATCVKTFKQIIAAMNQMTL